VFPVLAAHCGFNGRVDVGYVGRGLGFPQTVNDQPADWHIQPWCFEVTLLRPDGEAEAGYELAELVQELVASDQTLRSRVREAWVPVADMRREIKSHTDKCHGVRITLPLSVFDVEAGPAT